MPWPTTMFWTGDSPALPKRRSAQKMKSRTVRGPAGLFLVMAQVRWRMNRRMIAACAATCIRAVASTREQEVSQGVCKAIGRHDAAREAPLEG